MHKSQSSDPEDRKTFASGLYTVEAARAADGTYPAWDFFKKQLSLLEQTKLQQLFDYIAATGVIRNPEKFKKIETHDELFEFKNHQIRMPCFWAKGRKLIVTHGFKKKQDRISDAEIRRAQEIRNAHQKYFRES